MTNQGPGAEPPDHRRHRPERRGRPGPRERVLPGEQPPAGGLAVRRRLPADGEGRVPVPRRTVGQRQARLSVDVIALQELPCPCAAAMPPPEPPPQCLAAGRGRLPAHREPELHPVLRGIVVRRLAPRAVRGSSRGSARATSAHQRATSGSRPPPIRARRRHDDSGGQHGKACPCGPHSPSRRAPSSRSPTGGVMPPLTIGGRGIARRQFSASFRPFPALNRHRGRRTDGDRLSGARVPACTRRPGFRGKPAETRHGDNLAARQRLRRWPRTRRRPPFPRRASSPAPRRPRGPRCLSCSSILSPNSGTPATAAEVPRHASLRYRRRKPPPPPGNPPGGAGPPVPGCRRAPASTAATSPCRTRPARAYQRAVSLNPIPFSGSALSFALSRRVASSRRLQGTRAAPVHLQAPAEAVFAASVRESEPELGRQGEAVADGGEAIAQPELQAAVPQPVLPVVVGRQPRQGLAPEERVHAALRRAAQGLAERQRRPPVRAPAAGSRRTILRFPARGSRPPRGSAARAR